MLRRALGLFADHGFAGAADLTAAAPPAPRADRGADPTGFGLPVTAGLAADPVNTALGNFVEVETDLAFDGLLTGLTFARTYNSRADHVGEFGAFGPGRASWASTRLVPGTWAVEYEGPDGQRVTFPRLGAGRYGRAVGIDALVEPAEQGPGWVLDWFDGARWEFEPTDGRPGPRPVPARASCSTTTPRAGWPNWRTSAAAASGSTGRPTRARPGSWP